MITFTCNEMAQGKGCDMAFEGLDYKVIGEMGGKHIMESTDELHAPLKADMMGSDKVKMDAWWAWFKGEFDKKESADPEE